MSSKGKAVVAMSGGVDSSVAAALMLEEGWQPVGVTLKLMPRQPALIGCCGSSSDIDDAKRVCEELGIAHYTLDLSILFEDRVIRPFVDSYLAARTPNPCVECNRSLKFGFLLSLAEAWGAACVATGHYARVEDSRLWRAKDAEKDQSYFLYSLTRRELGRVRFPLGDLRKTEVRRRALALGLKTAAKPDSQEICFVGGGDYRGFIKSRLGGGSRPASLKPGPIKDAAGRELGRHGGLAFYTVGQRKGLGGGLGGRRYVVELEPETNTLVVGGSADVFCSRLTAGGVSWTVSAPQGARRAEVRIRHGHVPAPAVIRPLDGDRVSVAFDEPQRAVTRGQAAVFYSGDEVLGGGTIVSRENV